MQRPSRQARSRKGMSPSRKGERLAKVAIMQDGLCLTGNNEVGSRRNTLQVVNVAMVPQRSPFRYPGGKTWLVPHIRRWLRSRQPVAELIEPFAGGAIIGLTAAFEALVEKVTLFERDPHVASVWKTILNGQGRWLADKIVMFDISEGAVRSALETPAQSLRELAFQTILRNRVQRGGILAAGAGFMKNGENGRGLASRWYPETLYKRIMAIASIRSRIMFEEGDGMDAVRRNAHRKDVVFFLDPPYTVAGRRLYTYSMIDHEELFDLAGRLTGDFLMTYDNAEEIQNLAERNGFETRSILMKNTHHAKMTELLIGRNLNWLPAADNLEAGACQLSLQIS